MDVRRLCSQCTHGALSEHGVFCTLFKEPIVTESVAEDCSEYDTFEPTKPKVEETWQASEQERQLRFRVNVEFYGKPENGDKLEEDLRRRLVLWFGDRVVLERDAT